MNDYSLRDEIGRGNGSIVYKGRRKRTILFYAFVCMEKWKRERVLRNVAKFRSMQHPNVLQFHSWYETSRHLWVVCEYCSGGDLRTILSQDKPLREPCVRLFGKDIIKVLHLTHSKGAVHRDLKPSNFLIDSSATVKCGDFGLSCSFEEAKSVPLVGTPLYMAPELFVVGIGVPSVAADLWSLGVVFYEMLSGEPPFQGENIAELLQSIFTHNPARLQGVSDGMNDLVQWLLCKNPIKRPTWNDVFSSEVWEGHFNNYKATLPEQPAWENFVRSNNQKELLWSDQDLREAIHMASTCGRSNVAASMHGSGIHDGELDGIGDLSQEVEFIFTQRTNGSQSSRRGDDVVVKTPSTVTAAGRMTTCLQYSPSEVSFPNKFPASGCGTEEMTTIKKRSTARCEGVLYTGADLLTERQLNTFIGDSSADMDVASLIWHEDDISARPIFGNSRFDRYSAPTVYESTLPFSARSTAELRALPEKELLSFIGVVYENLASEAATLRRGENILRYLETVIYNDAILCNLVANSSLMPLFVDFVSDFSKTPSFRQVAATVLALTSRFTTFLGLDFLATGVIYRVFRLFEKETDVYILRRLISAIGEILFYLYSPKQENGGPPHFYGVSPVNGVTTTDIQRTLIVGMEHHDTTTRLMALRAVENLATLPEACQICLGTPRMVTALLAVWAEPVANSSSAVSLMKCSALCSALRVATFNDDLIPIVFISDNFPRSNYAAIIKSMLRRLGHVTLNFVNVVLIKSMTTTGNAFAAKWATCATNGVNKGLVGSNFRKSDAEEMLQGIVEVAASILDGLSEVVEKLSSTLQAKSLIFILLLSCLGGTVLAKVVNNLHVAYVDRVMRDTNPYTQLCAKALATHLSIYLTDKFGAVAQRVSSSTTPLYLASVHQLLSSSSIRREVALTDSFFCSLAECVEKALNCSMYQPYEESFNSLCDRIIQSPDLVVAYAEPICIYLIPPYTEMLQRREGVRRFAAVHFLVPLLVPLTSDSKLRSLGALCRGVATVVKAVAESFTELLAESSPIPTNIMRLLISCGEWNSSILQPFLSPTLLSHIMGYINSSGDVDMLFPLTLLHTMLSSNSCVAECTLVMKQKLPQAIMRALHTGMDRNMEDLVEACCELAECLLTTVGSNPTVGGSPQCLCMADDDNVTRVFLKLCSQVGASAEYSARIVNRLVRLSSAAQKSLLSLSGLRLVGEVFSQIPLRMTLVDELLKAMQYSCEHQRSPELRRVLNHEPFMRALQSLASDSGLPWSTSTEAQGLSELLSMAARGGVVH